MNDPILASEWHPTKNGNLTPDKVTNVSGKRVWWKCPKGDDHEWEAIISSRSRGNGCPFCANRYASKDNNLAHIYPELSKEWHPSKNRHPLKGHVLLPENFTPGSDTKVWWKCSRDNKHQWEARIANRVR